MALPRSCGDRPVAGQDLSGFHAPRLDPAAVEDSFRVHMDVSNKARARTIEPPADLVEAVLRDMDVTYEHQQFHPTRWNSLSNFRAQVMQLEWSSIVGPEMEMYGQTNRQLFKFNDIIPDREREQMVWQFVSQRIREYKEGPIYAQFGTFIKHEEHSDKKLDEGRFRLIAVPSVIDSLVHRMLFPYIYDRATLNRKLTSMQIGWTFRYGGIQELRGKFQKPLSFDMSSWDFTVQEWLWAAGIKHLLGYGLADPGWQRVARHALWSAAAGEFHLPSGTVVRANGFAYLKSGLYFTLYLNSIMSEIYHEVALRAAGHPGDATKIIMGDDTVVETSDMPPALIDKYVDNLGKYGAKVKQVDHALVFCGFNFDVDKPEYTIRHCWRVVHKHDDIYDQELWAYLVMYYERRHEPFWRLCSALYSNHFGEPPDLDKLRLEYHGH
uniref:RNA-dependent RNA polymerase n=1 Tax=Soybean thrips sobemo-like virus 1 TaxID=2800867 RepID=A0A7T8JI79_9VIRU|nr:RNA-dependent RNA polymerase [Soybean thrips sobemo-like virus 1]